MTVNDTIQIEADRYPTVQLFDIPIKAMTMKQALDLIDTAIAISSPLQIGVVNAAKVVNMHRNPDLGADVLSSDVIFADGASVVWASRLLGNPLPERVAGIDLMMGMLERGNHKGYRVYLLGATEEINSTVAERITTDFPGVIVSGRRNGYYLPEEEESIANDIAQSEPDILFVAITSPKKEQFLSKWSDTIHVPICHGVGGSFDVYAGKVKRAPLAWQRCGMEWLYRLVQEPRRMWKRYLVTNSLFFWLTIIEVAKRYLH
ncbi:WecB/TagA/CpsF family glycosyltransferase [Desulfopila aestuarii]|uniref:N-acetylmannosaminyltransferase n=1 Tax=Desulfopila aestuarii DSM 18488 TaxID=1121416 RepID=A0A1M7YFN4_9BACT|nr:WecB/TagA/CpsF family glycosyltransferase [Desulfopila aestuarii]SHO51455.1 N-acetylmannosaminyltransferase [Desulfopila aestuarii DSM 18488]